MLQDALEALTNWAAPSPKDRLLNMWRPIADRPADDAVAAVSATLPGLLKDAPDGVLEMGAKLVAKLSITAAGKPLAALVAVLI